MFPRGMKPCTVFDGVPAVLLDVWRRKALRMEHWETQRFPMKDGGSYALPTDPGFYLEFAKDLVRPEGGDIEFKVVPHPHKDWAISWWEADCQRGVGGTSSLLHAAVSVACICYENHATNR